MQNSKQTVTPARDNATSKDSPKTEELSISVAIDSTHSSTDSFVFVSKPEILFDKQMEDSKLSIKDLGPPIFPDEPNSAPVTPSKGIRNTTGAESTPKSGKRNNLICFSPKALEIKPPSPSAPNTPVAPPNPDDDLLVSVVNSGIEFMENSAGALESASQWVDSASASVEASTFAALDKSTAWIQSSEETVGQAASWLSQAVLSVVSEGGEPSPSSTTLEAEAAAMGSEDSLIRDRQTEAGADRAKGEGEQERRAEGVTEGEAALGQSGVDPVDAAAAWFSGVLSGVVGQSSSSSSSSGSGGGGNSGAVAEATADPAGDFAAVDETITAAVASAGAWFSSVYNSMGEELDAAFNPDEEPAEAAVPVDEDMVPLLTPQQEASWYATLMSAGFGVDPLPRTGGVASEAAAEAAGRSTHSDRIDATDRL